MKRITFKDDEESRTRFTVLFRGFIMGLGQEDASLAASRMADKVYGKFEKISELRFETFNGERMPIVLDHKTKEPDRSLVTTDGKPAILSLEDAEAELVTRRLGNVILSGLQNRAKLALIDSLAPDGG